VCDLPTFPSLLLINPTEFSSIKPREGRILDLGFIKKRTEGPGK